MYNELLNEKFNCKLNKIKEKALFDLVEKDQHYQLHWIMLKKNIFLLIFLMNKKPLLTTIFH